MKGNGWNPPSLTRGLSDFNVYLASDSMRNINSEAKQNPQAKEAESI